MRNENTSADAKNLRNLWALSGGSLEILEDLDGPLAAKARSRAVPQVDHAENLELGGSGRPSFSGWCNHQELETSSGYTQGPACNHQEVESLEAIAPTRSCNHQELEKSSAVTVYC